jgi:hypothetical protein
MKRLLIVQACKEKRHSVRGKAKGRKTDLNAREERRGAPPLILPLWRNTLFLLDKQVKTRVNQVLHG